jgi:diacylglycerol kinase (ATP)
MKNHQDSFSFKGLLNSFKNAFRGFGLLVVNEYNLHIQIFFGVIAIIFGFIFKISHTEWMIQSTVIGLVIFAELTNTAVEKIMNMVQPEYDERVRDIKDLAAGSVLFMVLVALTVGSLIYIPKIFF